MQRIFPEIIWIGFVLEQCAAKRGIEVASSLLEIAFGEATVRPQPEFAFLSAQRELTDADWERIRNVLDASGKLSDLRGGLVSFVRCYPRDNPLRKLWANGDPGDFTAVDVRFARRVVRPRLNRWSFKATVMQSVALYAEALTGRMNYSENVRPPDLEAMFMEFESEEGQRAASHARMHTTTSFAYYAERLGLGWAEYFWRRGLEIDPVPSHLKEKAGAKADDHVLVQLRRDFDRMATGLLKKATDCLISLHIVEEVHAVVTGLLARQTTLAIAVIKNVEAWNWDIGPLYLRAMVDCYITLAWILKNPGERSRLYIQHGLGQEKLWMAHFEEEAKTAADQNSRDLANRMIEISKAWVEGQRFLFLVTVNLGSWAGKNAREMAEEAGCMDLYIGAYLPNTFSAHSTWNFVGKFNSVPTDSPLNKDMRMPMIPNYGPDPSIAMNAAKYLDKSLVTAMGAFEVKIDDTLPWGWLAGKMGQVVDFLFDNGKPKRGKAK